MIGSVIYTLNRRLKKISTLKVKHILTWIIFAKLTLYMSDLYIYFFNLYSIFIGCVKTVIWHYPIQWNFVEFLLFEQVWICLVSCLFWFCKIPTRVTVIRTQILRSFLEKRCVKHTRKKNQSQRFPSQKQPCRLQPGSTKMWTSDKVMSAA